jgi:hypothetical protein
MGGDKVVYVCDAVSNDHTLAVSLLSGTEKGVVAVLLPTKMTVESRSGSIIGGMRSGRSLGRVMRSLTFMGSVSGRTCRLGLNRLPLDD